MKSRRHVRSRKNAYDAIVRFLEQIYVIRDMCLFLEHRTAILIRSGRLNCSSLKGYVIVVMNLAVIPLVADYMVCQIVATAYDWGSRKRIENTFTSWDCE